MPREGLGDKSSFSSFHPLVSFAYFVAVLGLGMFSMHPLILALTVATGAAYTFLLGGGKALRDALLVSLPLLVFTVLLNPLFNHRGATVLFYLNDNAVTLEAILYGLAAASMLVGVILWFGCFGRIVTADKFIYLFGRVLPSISLVLSMCLRYIPMLRQRYRQIAEGQRCMGRVYGARQPIRRLRQVAREVSILIAWSLESSIETSDSMEARGYGLPGRTSFHIFRFTRRDGWALAVIAVLSAVATAGLVGGITEVYYYPSVVCTHRLTDILPVAAAHLALLALPIFIDIEGERRWRKWNFEM